MKDSTPEEIAEMKARGYDPSTVASAEQQSTRRANARQVCRAIETAFAGVKLGKGVGLQEGQGLDDYANDATRKSYRANDEKNDWRSISAEALNRCHSSLSFFDAEGMRFHLPAFLTADLKGDYGMDMVFCLTHRWSRLEEQFSLLSTEQRLAVRGFLLHISDQPENKGHRREILRALNDYWILPTSNTSRPK